MVFWLKMQLFYPNDKEVIHQYGCTVLLLDQQILLLPYLLATSALLYPYYPCKKRQMVDTVMFLANAKVLLPQHNSAHLLDEHRGFYPSIYRATGLLSEPVALTEY